MGPNSKEYLSLSYDSWSWGRESILPTKKHHYTFDAIGTYSSPGCLSRFTLSENDERQYCSEHFGNIFRVAAASGGITQNLWWNAEQMQQQSRLSIARKAVSLITLFKLAGPCSNTLGSCTVFLRKYCHISNLVNSLRKATFNSSEGNVS